MHSHTVGWAPDQQPTQRGTSHCIGSPICVCDGEMLGHGAITCAAICCPAVGKAPASVPHECRINVSWGVFRFRPSVFTRSLTSYFFFFFWVFFMVFYQPSRVICGFFFIRYVSLVCLSAGWCLMDITSVCSFKT